MGATMQRRAMAVALPANRKALLLALAHFHDDRTGRCDPAIETLMQHAGMSRRGVQHGLKDLQGSCPMTWCSWRPA